MRASNGRIGDFVAVEMQDRQNGPVACRIEKLITVPTGGERPRFGLAVANNAGNDQVRVIEGGTEGVAQAVAKFASFVDRSGVSGATWLGMPPGNENCMKSRLSPSSSCVIAG